MIDGVIITPLRQFPDERGRVMHMIREDSAVFQRFGEVYFSTVYPGAIKGWHRHKRVTINYAVPFGDIKFVIHDDRDGSPTRGRTQEIFLSPRSYNLVTVPPMLWYGFKGLGSTEAIVVNCATHPHDPAEAERKAANDGSIGYDWSLQHG
jgi:dTDP-4-dehydrorhamnose 3,5-epimerase